VLYDEGLVVEANAIVLRALVQPIEEIVVSLASWLLLNCPPLVAKVIEPRVVSMAFGHGSRVGELVCLDGGAHL
jgi:hypothetical protein